MVGVYRRLGEEVVDAAGKVIHSTDSSNSQIMYSPDGYIGVVSTPSGRKTARRTRAAAPISAARRPEELAEATRAVTCYAGHYELKDGEVHHHVEMALNPNLVGQHADPPRALRRAEPDAVGAAGRAGQCAGDFVAEGVRGIASPSSRRL